VLREGLLAAGLTALMILLFIGSWRSTLIVCTSIPLSILTSLILLYLLGETINVMTLGGLALAIGILVDEATVEIENIHRNLAMGKSIIRSVLDGAREIAVPAFVSALSIPIVFVPVILLRRTAKYRFQPLAMGVVFAMLASYILSRTLIPGQALQDSPRLGSLVRDGNLYPSLQAAIAIALENNLDVELQRIGPGFAETDITRTRAGALPRGVPFSMREGPKSAGSGGADCLAPLLGPAPETNLSIAGQTQLSSGSPLPSLVSDPGSPPASSTGERMTRAGYGEAMRRSWPGVAGRGKGCT